VKTPIFARTILPLLATALVAACSPDSPKLMAPVVPHQSVEADGGDFKIDFNPKVDILFVVDNSASMRDHQTTLARNIDLFVNEFAKNGIIDFHLGIVSVTDSISQKPGSKYAWPVGQLRPLKAPGQKPVSVKTGPCTTTDAIIRDAATGKPGFITRETPQALEVLRESLKLGVQCLEEGGPEYEELFSPVAGALSPELSNGANAGFYRDDAHLAIFIVSDASPSNREILPLELKRQLLALKNSNTGMISVHAIGVRKNDTCPRDPSLKGPGGSELYPMRLEQLTKSTSGRFLSLCDKQWGRKLSDLGADIRRRTIGRTIILKNGVPERGTIKVKYGSQILPTDSAKIRGWTYDERLNAIEISGDVVFIPEPGAQLSVEFTPADLNNLKNGRTVLEE
jgi:hypothetical protein